MKVVNKVIELILNGENDKAQNLFVEKILDIKGITNYGNKHEDFSLYLDKYADLNFGENKGYIESFDPHHPYPTETRNYLDVLHEAYDYIAIKNYNNAIRDLLAIGQYISSKDGLYDEKIVSFYTLLLLLIAEKRRKGRSNSETDDAFRNFIIALHSEFPDKYTELCKVVFRDFKSIVLKKLKNKKDGLSVFEIEFNKKSTVKEVYQGDIDKAIDEFNDKLGKLIGLSKVKDEIQTLINFAKINLIKKQRGIKVPNVTKHLVFTGNPGTGKTTVARLLSEIYFKLGLLSKGHFVEAERGMLVGEYVGHTAPKTKKVIESAKGGILFIDEAYSLVTDTSNDFGNEAIETLLKLMEDNREDLIVVVAGYPKKMTAFLESNPGLNSRFSTLIHFEDYNPEQLVQIFEMLANEYEFKLGKGIKSKLIDKFKVLSKSENFGNARDVRNIFDIAIKKQANRLATATDITDADLTNLSESDIV